MLFITSDTAPVVGEMYTTEYGEECEILEVYTGFLTETYTYDEETDEFTTPWAAAADEIRFVIVEDEIAPQSTAYWFASLVFCAVMDVSKLDISNVTDMTGMFYMTGREPEFLELIGISDWDTSAITNMAFMFAYTGMNTVDFVLDLSAWDTSSVENMQKMFWLTGKNSETWTIGDISGWNTSSVTNMDCMFDDAGLDASYSLDLSGWDVSSVTTHADFNLGVESKIIAPVWKN